MYAVQGPGLLRPSPSLPPRRRMPPRRVRRLALAAVPLADLGQVSEAGIARGAGSTPSSRRGTCSSIRSVSWGPIPGPVADLPEHLATRILLGATEHEDLLRHVAICAQVCTSWRRVVSASAAYGGGWAADEPGEGSG
jgi:hypothetical protein